MNFQSHKKEAPNLVNHGKRCVVKVNRSYQSQLICNIILNDILTNGEGILAKKEQFSRFIDGAKIMEGQNFVKNSCSSVIQNFFAEHECLSPKMVYENKPDSSIKSPHSFVNHYQEYSGMTERSKGLIVKRQYWGKRTDNNKIYNCNKVFVHKKKNVSGDTFEENRSQPHSALNHAESSEFSERHHSHKNSMNKISIDHNVFVPRLSNRGRLTVNPFTVSNRSSPKHTFIQTEIPQKNRPSIFQAKYMLKNQIDHNNLVKLELKKRNSDKRSFKTLENQKETNNYITYLRDRKQKLQNIMKDFDHAQAVKKNERNEREVLMKQNKIENLAETYSKFPSMTTDYSGNMIRVHEKKISPQSNILLGNSFQMKGPRYEFNNQAAFNNNITYKIKDYDDSTSNLINQIFSSMRVSPSKATPKNQFSDAQDAKKGKSKFEKKLGSKQFSFMQEESDKRKSDGDFFHSSINSLESSKPRILINGISKQAKSFLRSERAKKSPQNYVQNINKQNYLATQQQKQTFKKLKIQKSKSNPKIDNTQRDFKSNQSSLIQLGKLYREQYLMKKERIHPQLLKGKKSVKILSQDTKTIQQLSSENTQRTNVPLQYPQFKNVFDFVIEKNTS